MEKKKRHWKQGEFPGISETYIPGTSRKPPIKNVKKKLDHKNKAKAWVNTVTESLSDCILKKQWLQALQVFEMLKEQSFYEPKEGTYMKLLVLLGRSGQPHHAHKLFDEMVEEGCEPTPSPLPTALAKVASVPYFAEPFPPPPPTTTNKNKLPLKSCTQALSKASESSKTMGFEQKL